MDYTFVLPIIQINIKRQTHLENGSQLYPNSPLYPLKTTKWQYLKMPFWLSVNHQNPYLLLHFYVSLSETFRIDVNMDFANNLVRGFLIQASEKKLEPKIQKKRGFRQMYLNMYEE